MDNISARISLLLFILLSLLQSSRSFVPPHHHHGNQVRTCQLQVQASHGKEELSTDDDNDDAQLIKSVTKKQLVDLCEKYQVSTEEGTKTILLQRLRQHAAEQAQAEKKRLTSRRQKVEVGCGESDKERYEIVDEEYTSDEQEAEDEGFFFFEDPHIVDTTTKEPPQQPSEQQPITSASLTSPPPNEANADGERVVKTYSTFDQNDLTGVAAAQPRKSSTDLASTMGAVSGTTPWDPQYKNNKNDGTDQAREKIVELATNLLASTGAPGFGEEGPSIPMTGFDPAAVPGDLLDSCSQALRTRRGQVLEDVMQELSLRAVGYDGMAGDDVEKGGGHYLQVTKVRAFLEGYRRAQVRRQARETTTLLLDKLVQEGVNGLDMTLGTMVRSSDDTGSGGELNDSLIEFLNDAIRQQEKKVESLVSSQVDTREPVIHVSETADPIDSLWNVTTVEGKRVETLNPNDPKVKKALEDELVKQGNNSIVHHPIPDAAPEKLLLLLTLLRERVKVEAAFVPDEKSRNLRLLAYCLRISEDEEREELVMNQLGNSLDRLDSFIELVASSIEYGESTSYELQPAKNRILNVPQLKNILRVAECIREKQSFRASGLLP